MKAAHLIMMFKSNWIVNILILSGLTASFAHSTQPTMNDLQSVMIHKIIQLTEWPNEASLENFTIGVYGSSSAFISNLNESYHQRNIRNKALKTIRFDPFTSKAEIQVLVIKSDKNKDLKIISDQLKNRNILLISESSNQKKHLMVNLLTTKDRNLSFEINRSNILLANLQISKDIIIAGGTELDIAKIYDQAVTDLFNTKKELFAKEVEFKQQSRLLKQQQERIQKLDNAITSQQNKLYQKNKAIIVKDSELKSKERDLRILEEDLEIQVKIIESSTQALEKIESNLILSSQSLANQEVKNLTLTEKIEANLIILKQQKKNLQDKEAEITNKDLQLNKADQTVSQQILTIQTQKNFLIVSILFGILFITLIITLYRLFIAKNKSSILLENKNLQLEKAMNNLHLTQEQLIESEKMASLGGMVAGIAHELNTPAGIVLTADTSLLDNTQMLKKKIVNNNLTQKDLDEYLEYSIECNNISVDNIKRIANLIKTFKQVAVDQSNNDFCEFDLSSHIDEALASLQYLFEGNKHEINVHIESSITLNSYPAVYLQLIHTLISNSLIHGFDKIECGKIDLSFTAQNSSLIIIYKDNGKGASNDVIQKIFDPFYTTKRGSGSSGLGTHILYNMVTQLLKGRVSCRQNQPQGLMFEFELPLELYPQATSNHSTERIYKKAASHSH